MTQATSATAKDARNWLLAEQEAGNLPEGVKVGVRGRLSQQAKEHFETQTGQQVAAAPVTTSAE